MPISITLNGQARDVAEQSTVSDLLVLLEFAARPVAVEVNHEVLPRKEHAARVLRAGDQVEVVTLVGGG